MDQSWSSPDFESILSGTFFSFIGDFLRRNKTLQFFSPKCNANCWIRRGKLWSWRQWMNESSYNLELLDEIFSQYWIVNKCFSVQVHSRHWLWIDSPEPCQTKTNALLLQLYFTPSFLIKELINKYMILAIRRRIDLCLHSSSPVSSV